MSSTIPRSKHGNCSSCPSTNCPCVKVGKSLFCIPCHRRNKGQEQITKANDRDKLRRSQPPTTSTKNNLSRAVGRLKGDKPTGVVGSKSELLRQADKLFADAIKRRDVKNGKYYCVCCKKEHNAEQVDSNGMKVINCGHFVSRGIYSLRFDLDNAATICGYSNKRMNDFPTGGEYQNFRSFLVNKFGEEAVAEMELQKRKINKIDTQMLKNVIEHYS